MSIRSIIIAALLTAAGSVSAHASCARHDQQTTSCGEGTVYDAETSRCVPKPGS